LVGTVLIKIQGSSAKQLLSLINCFEYSAFSAGHDLMAKVKQHQTEQVFMYAFAMLIDQIINLYIWTLLAYLAIGWLMAFKIINPWQPVVRMIIDALSRIHEPLLRPVRRILPDFGALDVSPIVLFLLAQFLRNLLHSMLPA
jgi:YggT family protein